MNKTKDFKLASISDFEVKMLDDGSGIEIQGYASTPVVDRDQEIIPVSAIDTANWEKNPILLYMHDRSKPIGKVVSYEKRTDGLWVKAFISNAAEKLHGVLTLIKDGVLKAFSVGFRIHDYFVDKAGVLVYKDIELLEVSVVSIPANQEAIFEFVKSLKEDSHKSDTPEMNKKGDVDSMEKMQEMEAQLKKLMEEKEAAEKALKAKEEAEKAAREEAEKAALKEEVKTTKGAIEKMSESIASITEVINTLKEEIKNMKEEVEETKMSKPKIEVKSADSSTIKTFMDKYKDAVIEAQLFGKKFTDTKVFSSLPEGAKSVSFDAQFTTMVHDQILEDVKQKAPLFDLFSKMAAGAKTDVYPFEGSVSSGWGSLSLTNYDYTGKIQFDYFKAMAGVEYKYEDEEDAVISWLPKVRQDIVTSLAEIVDDAIINGGGTTEYKGLIAYANDNAGTIYTVTAPNNYLTAKEIRAARAKMKKYGVNPKDLVVLMNSYKYLQLLDDAEIVTVDKIGDMATLINGSVGAINGSNILINDSFDGNDTASATEYSAVIFNKNMFGVKAKPVLVEIDKNIQTQNRVIVGSVRVSFIPLVPLTGGALPATAPIVVAMSNGI